MLPAHLQSERYDTKEEALEKAFEYYNKPSLGISVLRLDHHLGGEVMSKTKIEEWCRERQAGTSSESDLRATHSRQHRQAAGAAVAVAQRKLCFIPILAFWDPPALKGRRLAGRLVVHPVHKGRFRAL